MATRVSVALGSHSIKDAPGSRLLANSLARDLSGAGISVSTAPRASPIVRAHQFVRATCSGTGSGEFSVPGLMGFPPHPANPRSKQSEPTRRRRLGCIPGAYHPDSSALALPGVSGAAPGYHTEIATGTTVVALQAAALEWERLYNTVRPHEALGQLTPAQFLATIQINQEVLPC
jgi:hypothetical protein